MTFDHIVLTVTNTAISKEFYSKALAPLGIALVKEEESCAGFGTNGKPSFCICDDGEIQKPMYIAFAAPNRESIDDFYAAAILAGGKDNGKSGLREHYHPNYYAAYILDPDGHNIEAVCRRAMEKE